MKNARSGALEKFLDIVEGVGNRLPHPTIMFMGLILLLLLLTALLSALGISATTPSGAFPVNNLLGMGAFGPAPGTQCLYLF